MRLAVMRPSEKLASSVKIAEELGFDVVSASPVELDINDTPDLDRMLETLSMHDMVIFTSSNGVHSAEDLLKMRKMSISMLRKATLVAIGPMTADSMGIAGIPADVVPSTYSSEGIVAAIGGMSNGKDVYVLRSDHGDTALDMGLDKAGARMHEIIVYKLRPVDQDRLSKLIEECRSDNIDVYAFTSSLSAQTFIEAASKDIGRDRVLDPEFQDGRGIGQAYTRTIGINGRSCLGGP